jgi:hypothetical protein
MSDENKELSQLVSLITSLTKTVERQQETLEELKASKTTNSKQEPATTDDRVRALEDENKKLVDAQNKWFADQRKEKLFNTTKQGLLERGVDPKRVELAFLAVKDNLEIDKAGNMKMKSSDGSFNLLDVELTKWTDSDTGQFFKAPVEVNGGGTQTFQQNPRVQQQQKQNGFNPKLKEDGVMDDKDFNTWIAKSLGI